MDKELKIYLEPGKKNLIFINVLYILGVMVPILLIIGGAFAFFNKDNSKKMWDGHYVFSLRTFLYGGLVVLLIEVITSISIFVSGPIFAVLGQIINVIALVWVVTRSIISMQYIIEDVEHPNPESYWIK